MANAPNVLVINKARLLISPHNRKDKFYQQINCQSLEITPMTATQNTLTSTDRDDYGQVLASWAGDVTPAKISIKFDAAPPEVFAMAFGATTEEITEAEGVVIDEAVILEEGLWHAFKHACIEYDSFEIKDAIKTYENAKDFILDAKIGTILPVSAEMLAATDLKVSYTYSAVKATKMFFGVETMYKTHIKFSGINGANDKPVTGEIWEASFTPGDAINFHSKEAIAPTITGTLTKPADKDSPAEILFHK